MFDEKNSPIYQMLLCYADSSPARFHMPGHKGNASPLEIFGDALKFDVTELPETDNLFDDKGAILKAEKLAAKFYKTRETLFSAGGSTLCIQAMLRLVSNCGGKIICARNVHRAAVNAMALLGLEPVWVWPRPFKDSSLPGAVSPADIEKAAQTNRDAAAVFITSPDYYGVMSDISAISAVCKKFSLPLLVDNAHGAHLKLLGENLHPISLGAGMCCDSAHKTLPALTGGSYLHINSPFFSRDNAKSAMELFGSTSPSYFITLSLDLARVWMENEGKSAFADLRAKVGKIRKLCASLGFSAPAEAVFDPVRITIDTASRGISGSCAALFMRRHGISPEMCDENHLVLIPTPFNSDGDFIKLESALSEMPLGAPLKQIKVLPEKPHKIMSMRNALISKNETLDISDTVNRVAAEAKCPCPPGVPLIMPGELITANLANSLKSYGVLKLKVVK